MIGSTTVYDENLETALYKAADAVNLLESKQHVILDVVILRQAVWTVTIYCQLCVNGELKKY